jgi:hypothetical protein
MAELVFISLLRSLRLKILSVSQSNEPLPLLVKHSSQSIANSDSTTGIFLLPSGLQMFLER